MLLGRVLTGLVRADPDPVLLLQVRQMDPEQVEARCVSFEAWRWAQGVDRPLASHSAGSRRVTCDARSGSERIAAAARTGTGAVWGFGSGIWYSSNTTTYWCIISSLIQVPFHHAIP